MLAVRALPFIATLATVGCLADRSFDPDADIPCATQDDCPDNFVCRPALERCAPVDAFDQLPPRVVESSVTPELARENTAVTLRIVVDTELISDPQPPVPFVLVEAETDREALTWTWRGVIDRTNIDEGLVRIQADLVDTAGNIAEDVSLGELATDFTYPNPRFTPTCTVSGSAVSCLLSLTETVDQTAAASGELQLISDRSVRIALQPSAGPSVVQGPVETLSTEVTLLTLVDGSDPAGPWQPMFQVTDPAGNDSGAFPGEDVLLR